MNVDLLCADFLATADLGELFTASSGWSVSAGTGARGNDTFLGSGSAVALRRSPMRAPSGATSIIGFRYRTTAIPGSTRDVLLVYDVATIQYSLALRSDGSLSIVRGGVQFGTSIGTSAPVILSNINYYIEVEAVIGNAGSVTVYVNGVPFLTLTGVDNMASANAAWSSYAFFQNGSGTTVHVSDVYAHDGTGGVNDAAWGDTRVDYHAPAADGALEEWTRSAGADTYALLDDAAPDDDGTYLETATIGQRSTVTVQSLIPAGSPIRALALIWNMKKTDAGASTVAPVIRRASTNYDGTPKAPSENVYTFAGEPYDVDPHTSAQWTEADFNAAEFGVKKAG